MARSRPAPVAGTYPIDTGTAELAPDPLSGGWLLQINGTHSSHIDDDPRVLDFDYLRQVAAVIEDHYLTNERLSVLHLGGAACALARYLAEVYPQSRHVAVEIDGELARLVREWFELPRAPRLRIRVDDARAVVESLHPGSRDVIVRDAFESGRTPHHLTTLEFVSAVASLLTPGGIYFANCGDGRDLSLVRADAAAVAEVFDHVLLIGDPAMLKGRRIGNVVIVGSNRPLDPSATLTRRLLSDPLPAKVISGEQARSFGRGAIPHDPHIPDK